MATNKQFDNILSAIATDEVDTLEQLYEVQAQNAPSNVFLPYAHTIYDIDLNTRTIYGTEFISVRRDHKSNVIYFKVVFCKLPIFKDGKARGGNINEECFLIIF